MLVSSIVALGTQTSLSRVFLIRRSYAAMPGANAPIASARLIKKTGQQFFCLQTQWWASWVTSYAALPVLTHPLLSRIWQFCTSGQLWRLGPGGGRRGEAPQTEQTWRGGTRNKEASDRASNGSAEGGDNWGTQLGRTGRDWAGRTT